MNRPFVYFESFDSPELQHAITTRLHPLRPDDDNTDDDYSGLNLAFHVGDNAENVRSNRRDLAEAMGYEAKTLHAARQTHGAGIRVVSSQAPAPGALDWESAWAETDALITREAGVPVMILVADCAPILLADFENHILAVVHAGWRGAAGRIASKTVAAMCVLGADAGRIRAGIGPHLCAACFEIGEEVADAASHVAPNAVIRGDAKPHLNLDMVLRADLDSAGVRQIETMPRCPRCETETFFSHRGQNGRAGRFGLVARWVK